MKNARPTHKPKAKSKGDAGPKRPASSASPAGKAPVRPLHDRILVRRIEESEQRTGGIIIPDSAKEKPQQARVVAVGSGRRLESGKTVALAVKAGDRVLIGKWSGSEVKIEGTEYLILKEDEVLGVIG